MAEEGGVTVCVRVRPLIAREHEDLNEKGQVSWKSEDCTVSQIDGTRSFVFDRVFHSNNSTKEVYQGVTAPIINSAIHGYHGTVFAYGQTASGKTYTILGTKDAPGILPMAINDVFNTICRIPDREFLLRISYMEIHNETIQDLLCSNIRKKKSLVVREDINRTIYVEDLNEEVVISPEQVMSWLKKGEKNRHYGETKMNEKSSRSHTIFRMIIESKEKHTSGSSYEGAVMVSHLNFVDLAGSERASQTGAEGIRLKEGCNINRSLFILGQVIKKLCDDQSGGFINYRDSKLTRILQNSLGGNAKTVIICTITPASLEETLSTLQFANTAKNMKNTPIVNEVLDDEALLKRYRNEIEDLKRQLEEVSSHSHTKDQLAQLLEEKNSVQKEQQERIRALTEMLVTSSSFLRERELQAKKRRRVTWAPGALKKDGRMHFLEDFPGKAKRFKSSLGYLPEMEESVSSEFSEYDDQCLAASVTMPEEEWVQGSEINFTSQDFQRLLEERDNAVIEQETIKTKFDRVCSEKEQLTYELTDLREKISTHEFVALEKQASEQQEMQLTHEITNLKAIISNAEIYNQDLQQEINSKDMQCKDQEERITALEGHNKELKSLVEELKKDQNDTTILVQSSKNEELEEKQEELLALKEQLGEALGKLSEMAELKDQLKVWESTMETKEAQKSDMMERLQEDKETIRALTQERSDFKQKQETLEKERDQLKEDIQDTISMNIEAQDDLRNAQDSLKHCKKSIQELEETVAEKDKQISRVRETLKITVDDQKQQILQILQNMKLTGDLKDVSVNKTQNEEDTNQIVLEVNNELQLIKEQIASLQQEKVMLQHQIEDLEKEKNQYLEGNQMQSLQMNQKEENVDDAEKLKIHLESQVEVLQKENAELVHKLHNTEEDLKHIGQEKEHLRTKVEVLQAENDTMTQTVHHLEELVPTNLELQEQLKETLKIHLESQVEVLQKENAELVHKLHNTEEDLKHIGQEKEHLRTKVEVLQAENDTMTQTVHPLEELVPTNLELQGQLKEQLKIHLESQVEVLQKENAELVQKLHNTEEDLKYIRQEKEHLRTKVEVLQAEKDTTTQAVHHLEELVPTEQLKEQLKIHLESQVEVLQKENAELVQKLHNTEVDLKHIGQEKEHLRTKVEVLQAEKDTMTQTVHHLEEMVPTDQLKEPLKIHLECQVEVLQKENAELVQKLQNTEEDLKYIRQEKEHLRTKVEVLQAEKDTMTQTVHHLKELVPTNLELQEQLKEELKIHLESQVEVLQKENAELVQKLHNTEEDLKYIGQEKEHLRTKVEVLQAEQDTMTQTVHHLEELVPTNLELQGQLKEQLKIHLESQVEVLQKENAELIQKLHNTEEDLKDIRQEKEHLRTKVEVLQAEKDAMTQTLHHLEEMVPTNLELQGQLKEQLKIHLESQVEVLQKENAELVHKLHNTEEDLKHIGQEKEHLRTKVEVLQAEKDAMTQTVHHLEELVPTSLELQGQLKEPLKIHLESQVEVLQKENAELVQKLHNTEEDLKDIRQEKEHLRTKVEVLQAEKDATTQVEVLQKENAELVHKLHNTEEDLKHISQEKEHLRTKVEVLQAEKDTMTQTVHHLEELVPTNLELQEQLREANNSLREYKEMVEELKGKTIAIDSPSSKIHEELKKKAEDTQLEVEKLFAYVKLQEDEVNTQKNLVLEKEQRFQKLEEEFKEETKKLKEKGEGTQLELEKLFAYVKLQEDEVNTQKNLVLEKQQMFQKIEEEFKEETKKLKEKGEDTQLELEKLLAYVKLQEDEVNTQKNLVLEKQQMFQKLEEEFKEETKKLKEKGENTELELEKLLAYVKVQEDEVNTQKNLVLEKQQMFQKLEEEFKEETKKLKEKIQHLEINSFELQQLLGLKEEENQQKAENLKEVKHLESISESQMEALRREKTELVEKLQSTEKTISQEKEHLRTEMEALRTQKESMIQTVHHLSGNIDRLIPVNLKLQQELNEANNSLREREKMVKELKEKIVTADFQTLKIHEELKKKNEDSQLELEKLLMHVKSQEDEVNTQKNLVLEKQQMFQKFEEEIKEEIKHLKEKVIKSNEEVSSLTEEKKQLTAKLREQEKCLQQLLKEKTLLQKEKDDLHQVMQNIGQETQSQLQETLSENAAKITKLNEEANSLTEEKEQLTGKLREQEKCLQQLLKEKTLLQKERDGLQQIVQNIRKETQSQLQETLSGNAAKITRLNEEANSLTEEKEQLTAKLREQEKCLQQLLKEKTLLQKEREDLQQMVQNIRKETQSQLQETLSGNAAKITRLNEEANSLTEEKEQLTAKLREQEKCLQQLLKEKTLLQKEREDLQQMVQNIRKETQSQLQETLSGNAAKVTKLNEEANSLTEEKEQLTAKLREQEKCLQQLLKEKTLLQKEREDLQQMMENIRKETQSQLQETLSGNAAKDSEMNGKPKMQNCFDILEMKIFKMTEDLKKFPELEKTSEYFIKISLRIKNQFESQKALVAKWLPDLSPQEAHKIKRLQFQNERINNSLYSLLNELQYLFACLGDKRSEYYTNISKCTRELLNEQRTQHALRMEIQQLERPPLEQQGAGAQEPGVSELIQSLDGFAEQISKEVSEMEEELGSTKVMLQELEQYLQQCSDCFDLKGFEATVKQNAEKFKSTEQLLRPKTQPYFQARLAVEALITNYCRDIDATLKATRAKTKEMTLQLDVLKKKPKSCGVPKVTLKEENHKLAYKLRATEQDTKAQVGKGAELYKEEIEDLKTQLAKAEMARMKQSKLFDQEMANAKALAEHREQQLRKLKEELRKAQQEQDVTVLCKTDPTPTIMPITCGGGSGIVQNTHMLVIKSEYAKLEKEHVQLRKKQELLLTDERFWKEESKKWKMEHGLGDTAAEGHKMKSPKKAPTSSLSALPATPCKERPMHLILPVDSPQLMPLPIQSNFSDNPSLGATANTISGRTECEDNNFMKWLSADGVGDVSDCKPQ
ncbi:centromere-associated protein E isoform X2 [Erythrolamprus reginae]|uniref:centromere-associated protein E isoform X2 n=1 Tax=Erythrolamprus reginae TaxID=121349 RepID=UPI00396C89BA